MRRKGITKLRRNWNLENAQSARNLFQRITTQNSSDATSVKRKERKNSKRNGKTKRMTRLTRKLKSKKRLQASHLPTLQPQRQDPITTLGTLTLDAQFTLRTRRKKSANLKSRRLKSKDQLVN